MSAMSLGTGGRNWEYSSINIVHMKHTVLFEGELRVGYVIL